MDRSVVAERAAVTIGIVVLACFVALLLVGIPIAFSIGLASVLGLFLLDTPSWVIVSLQIYSGLQSFPLVAIPLFLLMANLMEVGGVTDSLVGFATSVFGRMRGSLAIGNVASSTLFAGISGSCIADTTAVGSMMIPTMVREGYPPAFAGAVTAAANIVGPIIPPSILMILYGFAAEQSVTRLFLAGILPGVLLSLAFAALAYWLCRRHGYGIGAEPFRLSKVVRTFVLAIPALVIPVIVLVGVVGGVFTVTESAGAVAVYALAYVLVRGALRGHMPWREIGRAFRRAALDTGVVMILLGSSSLLAWVLTRSQFPQGVVAAIGGHGHVLTLFLVNVVLLAFGMFLEPAAALLIAASIMLPLIKSAGVDLVHFGVMMVVNLQIGVLTPPVASAAFVSSRIAGISFESQIRALLPFIGLGVVLLALVTYVPMLSLWVPDMILGH
jgi:C4-dicarboxylate transporter DctM subunit